MPRIFEMVRGFISHDNTDHTNRYLHTFLQVSPFITTADITVDNLADYDLASTTVSFSSTLEGFLFPFGQFNYRDGGLAADEVVDVWWDANGVQVSTKYPLTVRLGETFKRNFALHLPIALLGELAYWVSLKSTPQTITLKARTQGAGPVTISNRYLNLLVAENDAP